MGYKLIFGRDKICEYVGGLLGRKRVSKDFFYKLQRDGMPIKRYGRAVAARPGDIDRFIAGIFL